MGLRPIRLSLVLAWMLQCTTVTETYTKLAKVGDDVTFTCEEGCHSATWTWTGDGASARPVPLVKHGRLIHPFSRLVFNPDCSLVVKNVLIADAGFFSCTFSKPAAPGWKVNGAQLYVFTDTVIPEHPVLTQKNQVVTESAEKKGAMIDESPTSPTAPSTGHWWRLVLVLVGLAALVVVVISVHIWTKTEGFKLHRDQSDRRDEDAVVSYENVGGFPAAVRFHRSAPPAAEGRSF
ncbi:uncharacterized protein LOC133418436 isoform X1 [Cololabis saira]|uniref:uncharacterized protein LOC133418436 isoform X1 n=1 Tax=Cololabis saira TaxID=129043 RepID=UPI002AD4FAB5|nr:uncharacterized protein LOC133418436 isoform X1 [Cololabis saira]